MEKDSEHILVEYLVSMLDNNNVKDTAMLCISTVNADEVHSLQVLLFLPLS